MLDPGISHKKSQKEKPRFLSDSGSIASHGVAAEVQLKRFDQRLGKSSSIWSTSSRNSGNFLMSGRQARPCAAKS